MISFGGSRTANMPIALQEFTKMSKYFLFAINHHYSVLKSCDLYSNQKPPICISNASKNRFKIYMVILVGNSITHTHPKSFDSSTSVLQILNLINTSFFSNYPSIVSFCVMFAIAIFKFIFKLFMASTDIYSHTYLLPTHFFKHIQYVDI